MLSISNINTSGTRRIQEELAASTCDHEMRMRMLDSLLHYQNQMISFQMELLATPKTKELSDLAECLLPKRKLDQYRRLGHIAPSIERSMASRYSSTSIKSLDDAEKALGFMRRWARRLVRLVSIMIRDIESVPELAEQFHETIQYVKEVVNRYQIF